MAKRTDENKWKAIPHRQRLSDPSLRVHPSVVFPVEEVAAMKEALKDVSCYDFALENVIAAGNSQLLRPSIIQSDDIDATIANVAKLDAHLEALSVQLDTNTENEI